MPEKIPRIFSPAKHPHRISRDAIMNGDIRAYFGPGQSGGVIDSYSPPTDWPEEKSVLKAPKVVWISLPKFGGIPFLLEFAQNNETFKGNDPFPRPVGSSVYNFYTGVNLNPPELAPNWEEDAMVYTPGSKGASGAYSYHYTPFFSPEGNPFGEYHTNDPDGTLAARVWYSYQYNPPEQEIVDEWVEDVLPAVKIALEGPYKIWIQEDVGDTRNGALTLPDTSSEWVGTDFLHIVIGGIITSFINTQNAEDILEDFDYWVDLAKDAKKYFPRIAFRFYKTNFTGDLEDPPPATDLGDYSPPPNFGPIKVKSPDAPVNFEFDPWIDVSAEAQAFIASQLASFNATLANIVPDIQAKEQHTNEFLDACIQVLQAADIDAQLMGTITDISAETLIGIIKTHYGFL